LELFMFDLAILSAAALGHQQPSALV